MLIAGGDMLCQTSPSGASRHLLHRGRHLTLPLPFVSKRKRKPIRCAKIKTLSTVWSAAQLAALFAFYRMFTSKNLVWMKMCIAHRLLLSTSEISDATASMPSPGYFALQHRVAPPRKAYSLTSSAFLEAGTPCPFLLFTPVFRCSLKKFVQIATF